MNNSIDCKKHTNWGIATIVVFFFATLVYLIIARDEVYIHVHDNLDSNIAIYRMLRDSGLYWTIGRKALFLGGIDRNYLYSDLKAYSWLFLLLPTLMAIIVGWYLKIIFSIIGFFFLGRTIYGKSADWNIFVLCGLAYGLCPTFPSAAFGFATLPLLLNLLILLYRKLDWRYYLFLLIYPAFSDFSVFGLFICGFLLVFFILDWIVERRPLWRFFIAIVVVSLGFIVNEWRLFYVMLFSNQESIRVSFATDYQDTLSALFQLLSTFVNGHYHSASSHTLIVLPACCLFFVSLNHRYIKEKKLKCIFCDSFNWIMMWLLFNSAIYAFDEVKWFDVLVATLVPPLKGFSFARTLWFSPFLWYFAFMIVLCRISWKRVHKYILCIMALIVVCLYPNQYNHIYWNCYTTVAHVIEGEERGSLTNDLLSYGEFYSEDLFDQIKEKIGYDDEWSIAYGMHPAILSYNGIATLDGYLSFYSMEYKEQFRRLIEPDLLVDPEHAHYFDSWGGRAYIFSKDVGYGPYRKSDVSEADMLIDPEVFREMGGKYVFSRVRVTNSRSLRLEELGAFTDEKSPYTIWVYRTR